MPPRVRSVRTSLSNCAKAASTPSISLPVDVSSIGSVAERQRYPERLQVRTQGKVIVLLPCEPRQVENNDEKDGALVFAAELQQFPARCDRRSSRSRLLRGIARAHGHRNALHIGRRVLLASR